MIYYRLPLCIATVTQRTELWCGHQHLNTALFSCSSRAAFVGGGFSHAVVWWTSLLWPLPPVVCDLGQKTVSAGHKLWKHSQWSPCIFFLINTSFKLFWVSVSASVIAHNCYKTMKSDSALCECLCLQSGWRSKEICPTCLTDNSQNTGCDSLTHDRKLKRKDSIRMIFIPDAPLNLK